MIIRKRKNWLRMLFVWQGSVLPKIMPRLALLAAFSLFIHCIKGSLFGYKVTLNPGAFTLMGLALAIFLGFCNTAAYDRFWEGRKLWGALVIDTRSIVRQILSYIKDDPNEGIHTREAIVLTIAYTYALKHQLRNTDPADDLKRLLPDAQCKQLESIRFKPILILRYLAEWVDAAEKKGKIDTITKMGIDQNIDKLSDIVGGCERIANTPIPLPYHILLHRTVYIYCFLLPFGLIDTIGLMTPIMVTFIGYTFIALDSIVDEISDPFGVEPNDLALNSICETVEYSLLEMAEIPISKAAPQREKYILD
jgi:putative membrane protein